LPDEGLEELGSFWRTGFKRSEQERFEVLGLEVSFVPKERVM